MKGAARALQGLVIGKFWPPHAGHLLLIQTAARQCQRLTVVVCDWRDQTPSASLRACWLRELCPEVEVLVVPDIGHDDDSARWAAYTLEFLGYAPDVVFTSESYGETYAHLLGAEHVSVDESRTLVPVSGTAVREDPFGNWDYLPPPTRAFYALRVCVLGAESTGTTTLASDLAHLLGTSWVSEYGREYSVGKYDKGDVLWSSDEFTQIALEQGKREDATARECNCILICDTDAFATTLWHERYMNFRSPALETIAEGRRTDGTKIDLYLVTDLDVAFVQDGYRDGEGIRESMHSRFIERLEETERRFAVVSGSRHDRVVEARELVRSLVALKDWTWPGSPGT